METITKEEVQKAISDFLDEKSGLTAAKKSFKKADEALAKEEENKNLDSVKITKAEENVKTAKKKLHECQDTRSVKFANDVWIETKIKAAKNFKFGTHISKGVHSSSNGDCINFKSLEELPHGVIGSQTIGELQIDGSGSAIGLPLFEFIEIDISGTKLKDLILKNSPSLSNIFSSDKQKSDEYFFILKDCLENKTDVPITDGLNKQLLWPLSDSAIDKDNYISLIPLYPSSFTLSFDKLRKDKFYSEKNKNARYGKTEQLEEYVEFIDSAIITLGGSQPQNVSKLVVSRKGKDYLLSSLPPLIDKRKKYSITKQQKSIFNPSLHYHCKAGFDDLYKVVESKKNNVRVRNMRKNAIGMILYEIICFAVNIQNSWEPGWSRDFDKLPECEKLWLDPKRAKFDEENDFMKERNMGNWKAEIVESFARWINNTLQKRFKDIKHQFGMTEDSEWVKEIEDEIKTSLRNGEEVFR